MAKYCPVAPINILEYMADADAFGSMHLMLAHHTVQYEKRFSKLMEKVRSGQNGVRSKNFLKKTEIIMDNSVIELGNSVDASMLKAAVEIVDADYLVLPDALHSHTDTIRLSMAAWETLEGMSFKGKYMILAQGNTIHEYVQVLEFFARYPEIKIGMVGVPRNAVAALGSRRELLSIARAIYPNTPIHLFGFSDNLVDDIICARSDDKPYSIDSAVPVRLGSAEVELRVGFSNEIPPRGDWWDAAKTSRTCLSNISYAKKLMER